MQDTIQSPKSQAKRELINENYTIETDYRFNINKIMGKANYRHPELWSLWYSSLFSGFIDGFNNLLSSPLPQEKTGYDDALDDIMRGFNEVITKSEKNTDSDISPIINMRSKFESFIDKETNEITIIIENIGRNGSIEVIENYVESDIKVDVLSESSEISDISSLREHRSELTENFVDYYNRPSEKYRRTLYISLRRTDKSTYANLWVDEERIKPFTLLERFDMFLNSLFA